MVCRRCTRTRSQHVRPLSHFSSGPSDHGGFPVMLGEAAIISSVQIWSLNAPPLANREDRFETCPEYIEIMLV